MMALAQEPEDIVVVGLSQDTAIITLNDYYHVLHPGETLTAGITLLSADSEKAILDINGQESVHYLSQQLSRNAFSTPKTSPPVRIFPDHQGLYRVAGQINGYPVDFIVDTGATDIAISSIQARRMGIHQHQQGKSGFSTTAAGQVRSYPIALKHVKVGHLSQDNVTAVIIEGEHPQHVLLGMSFLKHIQLSRNGHVLELRQEGN